MRYIVKRFSNLGNINNDKKEIKLFSSNKKFFKAMNRGLDAAKKTLKKGGSLEIAEMAQAKELTKGNRMNILKNGYKNPKTALRMIAPGSKLTKLNEYVASKKLV